MKIFSVLILIVLHASLASAEDGALNKLKRGAVNIATAPIEVVKQTRAYWIEGSGHTNHISFWLFSGIVKGVVETVKRAGSGVWDVLTFPLEQPNDYAPLKNPEYVFDQWPQRPGPSQKSFPEIR